MVKQLNPKKVMPVHTEQPAEFSSFHGDVLLKRLGEKYHLS